MSLKEKTITGVGWSATGRGVQQVIQFVISVLLIRLLTPEAFGLIGMIIIFTGFVQMFSDAGFGAALIQQKTITENHRSSIFWINIGVGLFLTIIVAASAPLIALFYEEPALIALTLFISLQFVIGSLSTVQLAILKRDMDFKKLTIIQISSQLISGSIAIGLAINGFGVWSLAWQSLISTGANVATLWWLSSWRPHFIFNWEAVRELLGFSSNLLGFNMVNYWTRNADDLLIGKLVGSAGLGIYTRAYATMVMPIRQVTSVLNQVMFPALSRIKEDKGRVKRIFLKSNRMIGLITIPMMVGLAVVAEHFVLALYGPKWLEVIPVLQILCLVGIKQPLESTMGWLYQSQGRTDVMFQWNLIVSAVTILAFIVGVQWGVIGVAWAYAIRSYVLWYHSITVPGKLIGMGFWDFVKNVSGIFLISLMMGFCVLAIQILLPDGWPVWMLLLVEVLTGIVSYLIMIHITGLKAYFEIVALIKERINHKKKVLL